jgi:hypothetical protein
VAEAAVINGFPLAEQRLTSSHVVPPHPTPEDLEVVGEWMLEFFPGDIAYQGARVHPGTAWSVEVVPPFRWQDPDDGWYVLICATGFEGPVHA